MSSWPVVVGGVVRSAAPDAGKEDAEGTNLAPKVYDRAFDVPLVRNVVYYEGKVYQAPDAGACADAAAAGGGKVVHLGMALNTGLFPMGNNWDTWVTGAVPAYIILQRFHMAGLLDPRFVTGEWGEEEEAEIRAAHKFEREEPVSLPTPEEYQATAEWLISVRPGLVYDFRVPWDVPKGVGGPVEGRWVRSRAGVVKVFLDGFGPNGVPISESEEDLTRRSTMCISHLGVGNSREYPYNPVAGTMFIPYKGMTNAEIRYDIAHSLRGLRALLLDRSFGADAEDVIPYGRTLTLISRQANGFKVVGDWPAYEKAIREVCHKHQFNLEVVDIHDNEFRSQLVPFVTSKVVVMTTGALMANAVTMRKDSTLLMIWSLGPFAWPTKEIVYTMNADDDAWNHVDFYHQWEPEFPPHTWANTTACQEQREKNIILNSHCILAIHPDVDVVVERLEGVLSRYP